MFDRVKTVNITMGQWIRVPFSGPHTAPLTLQLRSSRYDTDLIPAFLDGGDAAVRCPVIPFGRYKVVASDGQGNYNVGTVIVTGES